MLRLIIRFCIREPLIVGILMAVLVAVGIYSIQQVPIDAIPNVGENQVIVYTEWPGRSPKDVEDQITYPVSAALLAVPGAENVRGKSLFGYSFVQVTFGDDVDYDEARSQVDEELGTIGSQLPDGVTPTLGPDATALGQIFYYTLNAPPEMDLAELRSLQDYVIKYELQAVEGVSEVASVGGYVRQYQIEVDPNRLQFHNITLGQVLQAVKTSNNDVGAKTVESGGMEFIVRGKGFIGSDKKMSQAIEDIEQTVVLVRDGVPVRVKDVARVQIGPEFRRGAIDLNGSEAVGGVVVMRYGQNPRAVIERVREKIAAIEPGLDGVTINCVYDRTGLIDETMATLSTVLADEILITIVVIFLFLLHVRTSVVVALTLPLAVLMAFIAMHVFGLDANIMSLAGIAIAIGTMVDMGIIVTENIYQRLAEWEQELAVASPESSDRGRLEVISDAAAEVIPAVVTAVSTTVISFLPVFFLTGRDHKLFSPLAWTKTYALLASLIVAVVIVPPMCRIFLKSVRWRLKESLLAGVGFGILLAGTCWFVWGDVVVERWQIHRLALSGLAFVLGFAIGLLLTREKLRPIESNPLSRLINWIYEPTLRFLLRHRTAFLFLPMSVFLLGLVVWFGLPTVLQPVERLSRSLGAELNNLPGYVDLKHSITGLESDDWIALDEGAWFYMPTLYPAASFSQAMQILQTQDVLIRQIPEVANVLGKIGRVESALDPAPTAMIETYVMLKPRSEWREGVTSKDIWNEISRVATLPGVTPASPLQPIEGRVVMLQSGIKAAMAIRIYGDDLDGLAKASRSVAEHLKQSPFVNASTVNPDIVMGKPYIEFEVDRESAGRFEMSVAAVNQIIETALGGMNVTTTVEGRERYSIRVRYQRDLRERIEDLRRLPIVTNSGQIVPLEKLAHMKTTWGPAAINSENGRMVAHVSFATSGIAGDLESVQAIETSLREAQKRAVEGRGTNGSRVEGRGSRDKGVEGRGTRDKGDEGRGTRDKGVEGRGSRDEGKPAPALDPRPSSLDLLPSLDLPSGYVLTAVGSFQNQIEANHRLMWMVPLVMLINLLIIYLQFRNLPMTLAVFAGIPVSFGGGMIMLGLFGVPMNTATWIGFIALFGIAVDDGVIMATYLDQVYKRRRPRTIPELRDATVEAGLRRIRPCLMTTVTTLVALIPILISTGRGADVARAMALPVFGGMLFELIRLFGVPLSICAYKEFKLRADKTELHIEQSDTVDSVELPIVRAA